MSHFAEIDDNNTVLRVLVVPDEQEHRGEEYLAKDVGLGGRWIQTSYNGNIRKRFAGIGDTYDPVRDSFIPAKPDGDAQWNEELFDWEPID
jgi:hypothetical protein